MVRRDAAPSYLGTSVPLSCLLEQLCTVIIRSYATSPRCRILNTFLSTPRCSRSHVVQQLKYCELKLQGNINRTENTNLPCLQRASIFALDVSSRIQEIRHKFLLNFSCGSRKTNRGSSAFYSRATVISRNCNIE